MATLFVDKLDPQSGTALEIGTSGDTVTVPSGATFNVAGTLQSGGAAVSNTPAFSVILSASITSGISDNTWFKIPFDSEEFDTDGCFDPTTNYRFTPDVAGKYFFSAQWGNGDGGPRAEWISIYKNGSEAFTNYFYAQDTSTIDDFTPIVTGLIDMNGSSDYVEFYMKQLSGGGPKIISGDKTTWAYGYRLIGA